MTAIPKNKIMPFAASWVDPSPRKRKAKGKVLSEEALQIAVKRSERQRRKGKIHPSECRVPKKSKERKESFPQ